jgi:hypothetical protein
MTGATPAIIVLYLVFSLYKLGCLAVGAAFAFMGYRLFLSKLPDSHQPGEAQASWASTSITIKKAGPGAFFAFFGTLITVATVLQGFNANFLPVFPESNSLTAVDEGPTPSLPERPPEH